MKFNQNANWCWRILTFSHCTNIRATAKAVKLKMQIWIQKKLTAIKTNKMMHVCLPLKKSKQLLCASLWLYSLSLTCRWQNATQKSNFFKTFFSNWIHDFYHVNVHRKEAENKHRNFKLISIKSSPQIENDFEQQQKKNFFDFHFVRFAVILVVSWTHQNAN